MLGQTVVIATEAEDEVAGLSDVDSISDVLEQEGETFASRQGRHVALGQSQVSVESRDRRVKLSSSATVVLDRRPDLYLSERDCSTSRAIRAIIFSRAAGRYFSSARDRMSSSSSSSSPSSSDSTST